MQRRLVPCLTAFVLLGTLLAAVATPAAGQADPEVVCQGLPATLVGTEGNDRLTGTAGDDVIVGLGGRDVIDGQGGNDVVCAGDGPDDITTADGDDIIDAGAGNDHVESGAGSDQVIGGAGNDQIDSGDGIDEVSGDDGNDNISTGAESDYALGGAGNDKLDLGAGDDYGAGEDGNDNLLGRDGDDVLDGDAGNDTTDGGAGTDTCLNGNPRNCELGDDVLDVYQVPQPLPEPEGRPLTFTVTDSTGVAVEVDTNGDLYPWDVQIQVAPRFMPPPMEPVLAGNAYDITTGDDRPIAGAELTLPYDPAGLDGFDPQDLKIYRFDQARGFWLPVPGPQTVDAAGATVTATLSGFSVYAVLKIAQPSDWARVFTDTPVRCVSEDSGIGVDVVFLIDTSGSMRSNDPGALRVDGAKAFVDAMRANDRVAVVDFDSDAETLLDLTPVAGNETLIDLRLDATADANGGTDISDAVREAITVHSANVGEGRLKTAVLLTDGQSSYDTGLTQQAADALIEIHTVGLGAGVDAGLLRGIADGTGASYRPLTDASQLPEIYEELVGDIIDDGTNSDQDSLTDCVERNGAFVPRAVVDFGGISFNFSGFVTTNRFLTDSDGDGLNDDEELIAADLRDDPLLAAEYSFLIDQGLTTYYVFGSDPNQKDTDGDDIEDLIEVLNGTDPLTFDRIETDIPGLNYPPFTLFQPDRYASLPAIPYKLSIEGNQVVTTFFNDDPVRYADDGDCSINCDPIIALAERLPNDNGWGVCLFGGGDCVTDEGQRKDLVKEARIEQGVFDDDGFLSEQFIREQVAIRCALWTGRLDDCVEDAENFTTNDVEPDQYGDALAQAVPIVLPAPGVGRPVNTQWIDNVVAALRARGAVIAGVTATAAAVTACVQSAFVAQFTALGLDHPCEVRPFYSPGTELGTAHKHRVEALLQHPEWSITRYVSEEEQRAAGLARGWYIGQQSGVQYDGEDEGCTGDDLAEAQVRYNGPVECDEFPNYSFIQAGPVFGASLRYIPEDDNGTEGNRLLNRFYRNRICGQRIQAPVPANREIFGVVPNPGAATVISCGTIRN